MNNIEEHNRSETPARASRRAGGSGILARSGLLAMCMGLILTAQVRAVDPSLDVGDWALDSTSRTLPKVLNTAVNIGDFTFNVGAGKLQGICFRLFSRPPHRGGSERGSASGSEGVRGERGVEKS